MKQALPTRFRKGLLASRQVSSWLWGLSLLAVCSMLGTGCAAMHPLHGVPARYLPDELRGGTRAEQRTIDLSLMRQTTPAVYQLDSGDVLGVYIEGLLGRKEDVPPVFFPQTNDARPSMGYPSPVREDGTISVPVIGSLNVRGMSVIEAEAALRKAYTVDRQILQPHQRINLMLQRPRMYRVLVVRQENGSPMTTIGGGQLNLGTVKRGTGKLVNLPAYENDVLHAITETGGLPGLDAENAIYVIRSRCGASLNGGRPPASLTNIPSRPRTAAGPTIRGQSPANDSGFEDPAADWPTQSSSLHERVAPVRPLVEQTAVFGRTNDGGPVLPASRQSFAPPSGGWAAPSPHNAAPDYPAAQGVAYDPRATMGLPQQNVVTIDPTTGQPMTVAPGAWGSPLPNDPTLPPFQNGLPDDTVPTIDNPNIVRIPVRLGPGETIDFDEQDIILGDGDIIFIESRETEVFYTGGLLGGGQFTLPRDYDVDILGAIAIAQGSGRQQASTRAIGGTTALNNDVTISASTAIVIRQLPDHSQVNIQVNLYRALRDPSERILIQPGDYILLQYTKLEAVGAFIERNLLEGALFGVAAAQLNRGGN